MPHTSSVQYASPDSEAGALVISLTVSLAARYTVGNFKISRRAGGAAVGMVEAPVRWPLFGRLQPSAGVSLDYRPATVSSEFCALSKCPS